MVSCLGKSSIRKRFGLPEGDSFTAHLQQLAKLLGKNVHRIGWFDQHIIHAWSNFVFPVGTSTTEQLVRPITVLKRPWALFGVISGEGGSSLCAAATTSATLSKLVQLASAKTIFLSSDISPPTASTTLRAFAENVLEDIHTVVLFSEL